MNQPRRPLTILFVLAALGWLAAGSLQAPAQQPSQEAPPKAAEQPVSTAREVIKSQANLVLVDAVVTDHKDNYVRDLAAKDFKVYEDNKEQTITSFSNAAEANGPNAPGQRRYLVLFFDDSTMDLGDQAQARKAAAQFIDKTASQDRLMAVVDFGGTLQIAQNFTANTDRLKQVVNGVRTAAVNPNEGVDVQLATLGGLQSLGPMGDFASYPADLSSGSCAAPRANISATASTPQRRASAPPRRWS